MANTQFIKINSKKLQPRRKFYRKWTATEEKCMVDFLEKIYKDYDEISMGQNVCKRIVHLLGAKNLTWELVQWKLRNMKIRFQKAEKWRRSVEDSIEDKYIQNYQKRLSRMCPYYERLYKIFAPNPNDEIFKISKLFNEPNIKNEPEIDLNSTIENNFNSETEENHFQYEDFTQQQTFENKFPEISKQNLPNYRIVANDIPNANTVDTFDSQIMSLHNSNSSFKLSKALIELKMNYNKEKLLKNIAIRENITKHRIALQTELAKIKERLKIHKIENKIKLKRDLGIRKLQKKEKITKYELDLIYRTENYH